jgi:AsmA protein
MTDQRTPDSAELWQQELGEAAPAPRPRPRLARPRQGTARRGKRGRTSWLSVAGYAALALLCLCLGAVAFLAVAAPVDLIRDRVVEFMRDRTGRELFVAGGASVSLFPKVTVALGDVSVAPPQGMPGEPTLNVGAVEVEVGYWSLLTGRPKPQRVILHRPVIELAVDGEGRRSWDFSVSKRARTPADPNPPARDETAPDAAAATIPSVPDVGEVRILGGTVRYRNVRTGAQYELAALNLHAFSDRGAGPLRIEGSAAWRGEPVSFAGTVSPAAALAQGRAAQLALTLKAASLEATYEGSLAMTGGAQLEGKVSLKSPSLRALRAWLSKAAPGDGEADPLTATAFVTAREGNLAVSSLELTVAGSSAKGTFDVEVKEGRPLIRGQLMVSDLDMGSLLVRPARGARDAPAAARQAAPPSSVSPSPAPRKPRGWRDDPIDLALLRLADADIALSVGRLAYKDMAAGPGRLSLAVKGGATYITLESIELYGGRGKGVMTLDATAEVPVVSANLALVSVAMPGLLGDALGLEWLDGRGNVTLSLAGQGQTERQIVEGLNGKLDVAVADGAMVGADVGKIIARLQKGRFTNLTPAPGDRTPFSELAAKFDIVNGMATSRNMRLVSTHVNLDGEGTFALGERQMNCELRAKISGGKRGEGAALNVGSLELPITISGPWERPTYGIKGQEQILETVKQIGKRLKSNDVDETIRGLIGGDKEERAKAREKGRELLEKFLKKD